MAVTTVDLNLVELDKLKESMGATSRAEVIRKALGLLSLAEEKKNGKGFVSIGEGAGAVTVLLG